jgi:cholesterol oxidase
MHYDAIVIGSGFGGSVAACRLSQAGLSVLLLERGKRYLAGTSPPNAPSSDPRATYFPRNWSDLGDGWLWMDRQGLFDVRPFSHMFVVQSAGYGGGSLIYANVHLRPPEKVFAKGWPAGYSREVLDPYYDLVALMLDIKPITAAPAGPPPKANAMLAAARELGREAQFCYPNLAIDFGDPDRAEKNRFGALQRGCSYCGECVVGCTFHAKNTLDLNYLAVAESYEPKPREDGPPLVAPPGTKVLTMCEVVDIVPLPDENFAPTEGYGVIFRDHADGGKRDGHTATRVFVCAGAVGSTELLLRCKKNRLPDLSPRLGEGYSGNGDFLSFAFDSKVDFQPSVGPTITTGIIVDQGTDADDDAERTWFILQEGGFPKEAAGYIELIDPHDGLLRDLGTLLHREAVDAARAAAAKAGPGAGSTSGLGVFLSMGRDTATGRIELDLCGESTRIAWDVPDNLPLYNTETQLTDDIAHSATFAGTPTLNPLWKAAHQPISVHNLGGCLMADSKEHGVTDPWGEVWGYPGLYVLDGAILPAATGVNPSHTIAAVAERNVEHLLRSVTRNAAWQAPEWADAARRAHEQTPLEHDSLFDIKIPAGGTQPPKTPVVGLSFRQKMSGFVADDAGAAIRFDLAVATPDLDRLLVDPEHKLIANGTLWVHGLCNQNEDAEVVGGTIVQRDAEQRTVYTLPFTGCDEQPYLLEAWADAKDPGEVDVLRAMLPLHVVIRRGHGAAGPIVKIGVLRASPADLHASRESLRITGTTGKLTELEARERATGFFGALRHLFS